MLSMLYATIHVSHKIHSHPFGLQGKSPFGLYPLGLQEAQGKNHAKARLGFISELPSEGQKSVKGYANL